MSEATVLANVWSQNVLREPMALPILDPRLSTTNKIANALDMYFEHLTLKLDERVSNQENKQTTKHLRLLKKNFGAAAVEARAGVRENGRPHASSGRWRSYGSTSEASNRPSGCAGRDGRPLLSTPHTEENVTTRTCQCEICCKHLCAAAIVLFTDHARPGEWEHMTTADVTEMAEKGRDHLIAKDHETVKQFGPLAKHCPPVTQKALQLACDFPSRGSGLLAEPPRWVPRPPTEDLMTVCSSKLLRKCCAVYMPQEEEMWVTLKRKQQHCLTEEDQRETRLLPWPTVARWTVTVLIWQKITPPRP